jgi:hypothetical protein
MFCLVLNGTSISIRHPLSGGSGFSRQNAEYIDELNKVFDALQVRNLCSEQEDRALVGERHKSNGKNFVIPGFRKFCRYG